MSPSRRSVRGLARLQRSHSCTGRPAARQSAPRRSSFAVVAKSGAVIASAAKQSMAAAKDGLLRRFAPRNDVTPIPQTTSSSRREAPEPLMNLPPIEGVGNAGCPLHPRPRVHLVVVERTRVTTSTPESPDVPARNGFNGFLRALPGDRALLPPSPCGLKVLSSPVEPNEPPQDLTPASRRQDHTTSPSASSAVVLHAANRSRRAIRPALASHAQHCRVHRTPPRVRDDHDTPLWWGGMARVLDLIWVRGNKYFSENQK